MDNTNNNFKIGDWVVYGEHSDILQIEDFTSIDTAIGIKVLFKTKELSLPLDYAKKWYPKSSEWCVFWNNDNKEKYVVAKYDPEYENNGFRFVAPLKFLHTL